MPKLVHDLLTSKFTNVRYEDTPLKFNAPNHFVVESVATGEPITKVDFQEGPCKEFGANGAANEDVISMVICRLQHFQETEWNCRENAMAITKLEEALLWLRKRTMGRENRGVDGTYAK